MLRSNPHRSIIVTRALAGFVACTLAVPAFAQQTPPAQDPAPATPPADAPVSTPATPKTPQRQGAQGKGQSESGQMSSKARDQARAEKQAAEKQAQAARQNAAAGQAQTAKGAPTSVDPAVSIAATAPQGAPQPTPQAPAGIAVAQDTTKVIEFQPAVLDLGEMIADVAKTGTIRIVNISDKPVKVVKIVPGCGCTTTGAPPGEIAPGASADVDITLKPGAKAGIPLTKSVTFQIENHAPQILTVKGQVKAFINISNDMIDGPASPDAPPTTIKFTSVEGEPFKITGALPDVLVAVPEGSAKEHEVQIDWKKWEAQGSSVKISVMTDHPKAPQLAILVKRSIKPGINPPPAAQSGETTPALVTAAQRGDVGAVKAALAASPKVDDADRLSKRTALHMAAFSGNAEIAKLLLDAKAGPNVQDRTGKTPVTVAAEKGNAEVLKLLLAAGGDANARDQVQGSPLLWAAGLGTPDTVRVLLEAGANPNIADVNGMTPLMWASGVGRPEVVELLVAKGADLKATDRMGGETALMRAIRTGKVETVKLLLAKGGDIAGKNTLGMTPFLIACGYGNMDKIKMLIDAGADKTVKDSRGWGAIDHARNRVDADRDVVVKFLEPIVPASTATVQPPAGGSAPTTQTGAAQQPHK
jgi:ankyrin repeat protein